MKEKYSRRYKENAPNRHVISILRIRTLVNEPPNGVNSFVWETFIWIAWVFALRFSEIKSVSPEHVWYDKEAQRFVVKVVKPKVKMWVKEQHVYIKKEWIPREAIPKLHAFAENPQLIWEHLMTFNNVTPHIQKVLGRDPKRVLTFHSIRHGRITDLYKSHDLLDDQIMKIGRWRSRTSMLVYVQR